MVAIVRRKWCVVDGPGKTKMRLRRLSEVGVGVGRVIVRRSDVKSMRKADGRFGIPASSDLYTACCRQQSWCLIACFGSSKREAPTLEC